MTSSYTRCRPLDLDMMFKCCSISIWDRRKMKCLKVRLNGIHFESEPINQSHYRDSASKGPFCPLCINSESIYIGILMSQALLFFLVGLPMFVKKLYFFGANDSPNYIYFLERSIFGVFMFEYLNLLHRTCCKNILVNIFNKVFKAHTRCCRWKNAEI